MAGSTDAIAHVQEGIIVDANPAWIELSGSSDAAAIVGQPLMDLFDAARVTPPSRVRWWPRAGKWQDHSLKVDGGAARRRAVPLEMDLERFEFEGEPAVRVKVPTQQPDSELITQHLEEALKLDGYRAPEARRVSRDLPPRLAQPLKAGRRAVLYSSPTSWGTRCRPGTARARGAARRSGSTVRGQLQPDDIGGRLMARGYAALPSVAIPAISTLSFVAWRSARRTSFPGRRRSLSITASAGAALYGVSSRFPALMPRSVQAPPPRPRLAAIGPYARSQAAQSRGPKQDRPHLGTRRSSRR